MSARPAASVLTVWYDSREQSPFEPIPGVEMIKVILPTGDYTSELLQTVGVIERKSIPDYASSTTHHFERFEDELRRMGDYRWRAVVVEGSIDTVLREHAIHQNSVIGAIASFFAWRDVPVLFAGTRLAAARLTFGILRRWEERLRAEKEGRAP